MDPAETRYLQRGDGLLAYQVFGSGADVVFLAEVLQHLDLTWSDPHLNAIFTRLGRVARTAMHQPRGLGLSDPTARHPTLEEQADDALAVMDDLGMEHVTLVSNFATAGPAALVSARAPERVRGIVMLNPVSQGPDCADLVGWEPEDRERFRADWIDVCEHWGTGRSARAWHPSWDTAYLRQVFALLERCSASPKRAQAYLDWALTFDATAALRQACVPVRVLSLEGVTVPSSVGRHVADLIPGATFHLLPAPPFGASLGETFAPMFAHIEEMATGAVPAATDVRLGSVLFTDLVASTELLARIGDHAYGELRADHERQVRVAVERFGGDVRNVTGDGTVSVFDGAARAVECGLAVAGDALRLGLELRAAVHTGELEQSHLSLTGMTVHVAARVIEQAGPGELLVTEATRDLALDDRNLVFGASRTTVLKGVPGAWVLWPVSAGAAVPDQAVGPQETTLDRMAVRTARHAPAVARAAVRVGQAVQRGWIAARSSD